MTANWLGRIVDTRARLLVEHLDRPCVPLFVKPVAGGSMAVAHGSMLGRRAAVGSGIAMPNPTLEEFEAATRAGIEAVNRRDFAAAFRALPSDCAWHLPQNFAPEGILVGPEQVCSWFDDFSDSVPDWSNQLVRVLEADDGVFVVLLHGQGSGRASGAAAVLDLGHIWELRDSVPFRVREFATWEETLEAAGMSLALAGEVRRADC